jgi:aminoglycoside phosphotransferase family enzyme/predicted kinase
MPTPPPSDAPTDPAAAAAIVAALRRHLQARHGEVPLIETHISWVLLAGDHAYKLKKPVRFGFLDFSTLALRRRFCAEEVRLNRRLAPDLYLGVVPVRAGARGPSWHGRGPVLDVAVKMRRMAPRTLASERLADGTLTAGELAAFGRRLAAFHAGAAAASPDSGFGSPARVCDDTLQAVDRLAALIGAEACKPLRAWFAAQADRLVPRWQARQAAGRVREGHGDLHLDNVVHIGDALTAFDCIEFDPALRWIDTINDAGFLLMDLLAHGRGDLGFAFLDGWLEASGDHDGLDLLRHYLVYRAVVRALVTTLRGGPAPGAPSADAYQALARRLTQPPAPALLITQGLPASGKSWLTQALLQQAGAVRLRSDVERKRLAGLTALADSRARADDLYTATTTDATYAHLAVTARQLLAAGWPVIVDAAFLRRSQRDAFRALAAEAGAGFAILDCQAPMAVLRQRIAERRARADDASEADESVLALLAAKQEPLTDDERAHTIAVRTDRVVDLDWLISTWQGRPSTGPRR